ncbi:MAG: sugar kinase [Jannaschia sp.]
MGRRVIAIGECMLELSPAEPDHFKASFAGDTFNTAWYLQALAVPDLEIGYLSAVGDDDPSRRMRAFMRDVGITPHLAERTGGHVGLYMITLNAGERSFSYWRDTSAARSLADDLADLPGLVSGDVAFFSGITLAILPHEGRQRLLGVLATARSRGIRIVFDPNLRPRLWPDAATMRHWITEGAKVADIALPSFEDEASAFGDPDKAATAQRYADGGCTIVVVKDGPGAVLIRQASGDVSVHPEPVRNVVDTTAAGDAFNAGFLAGLLRGHDVATAARAACALSARVIGMRGALVDLS